MKAEQTVQSLCSKVLTDSWLRVLLSPVGLVPCLCLAFSSWGRDALRYLAHADPPMVHVCGVLGVICFGSLTLAAPASHIHSPSKHVT